VAEKAKDASRIEMQKKMSAMDMEAQKRHQEFEQ
jgi:hypothetical protein